VYDEAKRFSEALTMAYRATHGVDTAIARIFNTYGPRMRPDDGRAIPTFIRQALRGEDLTVAGDGLQTRSVVHVDDEVDGLLRLLLSDHPGPINIGSRDEWSVLDLARLVIALVGADVGVRHVDRPVDDPTVRRPDITLAARELGWKPTVPIEEGLAATIAWFRTQPGLGAGAEPTSRD
jgi:dTDP-glucose 4,6-dehydratase